MRDCKFHEFMDHVYNFNNVCPLTVWELEILERIKDIIKGMQYQRLKESREGSVDRGAQEEEEEVAQRIRMKLVHCWFASSTSSAAGLGHFQISPSAPLQALPPA